MSAERMTDSTPSAGRLPPSTGPGFPRTSATVASADGTTIGYQSLGSGDGIIVVGGVLRTARDYMDFGSALAESFTVHVMDRRGRGVSGPLGRDYSIEKECEDLLALQSKTGAERVFGHSYGGFVALETARRADVFRQLAVYEPGVSINGSLPRDWMPRYRELLAQGDTRGAFAAMVKQAGFAPRALTAMPLWSVRLILRLGIRSHEWHRLEPLLEANLAEHEQQARLDDGTVTRYEQIKSQVLLCGGAKSPAFMTTEPLAALHNTIPDSTVTMLDRLDHLAPEKNPTALARHVMRFFENPPASRQPTDNVTIGIEGYRQ